MLMIQESYFRLKNQLVKPISISIIDWQIFDVELQLGVERRCVKIGKSILDEFNFNDEYAESFIRERSLRMIIFHRFFQRTETVGLKKIKIIRANA